MSVMKLKYRLFRRSCGIYFLEDRFTRKQESLRTRDRSEAERLAHARNEASAQPLLNLQIARAYLKACDPASAQRTWQDAMNEIAQTKRGPTRARWERAMREQPFDSIRDRRLLETQAEHLLSVLKRGTTSTNIFLRRLHNFALDMNWLASPVVPRRQWPEVNFGEKRAITREEHEQILSIEHNVERRLFYELLWHIGGSQSDVATLRAENIDRQTHVISFRRQKTGTPVFFRFGRTLADILGQLPTEGFLFPRISQNKESDRAKQFWRSCRRLQINGLSLHSYRYAWAERARIAGYPERFAQEALGHASKAVHRAYAKGAYVTVPSLEEYEASGPPSPQGSP